VIWLCMIVVVRVTKIKRSSADLGSIITVIHYLNLKRPDHIPCTVIVKRDTALPAVRD